MASSLRFVHFAVSPNHCILFGILNVTPDSFSDGGRFVSLKNALAHARQLELDGADVMDVGGESTRPGAQLVSAAQEMERILPVIRALKQTSRIRISVDTTKADVAEAALAEGASIVNDVSGLTADPRMASVVAKSKADLILMHSRGTPSTMQTLCDYADVIADVKCELGTRLHRAIESGIAPERITIDPGIGFAKTREQNWTILKNLSAFVSGSRDDLLMGCPLMVGVSRKSFLGGTLEERGASTLDAEMQAWCQGVRLIRTHDVGALRRKLVSR